MSINYKRVIGIFTFFFVLLLCSCLGINTDIVLNQNGSGTITLEYHISKALDSLGKLDGNERWNTIPVGRADFERTLARLPDMKLLSFSSKEDEKDLIIHAKMEFSSTKGLLAFLDAGGRRSVFSGDGKSGSIALTLSEGTENKNAGLAALIAQISESYTFRMSMTFPGEGNLSVCDSKGTPLNSGNESVKKGKTVSCSLPLREILLSTEGIVVSFNW